MIFFCVPVNASTTDGNIDGTNRYAWSENTGWIDFGTTVGNIHVTDLALSGYAYGENVGWISLNCSNTSSCASNPYAVANTAEGTLSGYAWSENAGWINFAPSAGGVTISSTGVFSGYAYSENLGWINFTADHPVTTDWRPESVRNASTPAPSIPTISSSGGGGSSTLSPEQLALLLAPSPATTAYLNSLKNIVPGCPIGFICTSVTSTTQVIPPPLFTRDLTLGSVGADVRSLQIYLNAHDFIVALSGAGSAGHETTYFGRLTRVALAMLQNARGISPPVGYFGPKTRSYIAKHP